MLFAAKQSVLRSVSRTQEALDQASLRLSTGKKLNTASDDPVNFARAERAKVSLSDKSITLSVLGYASERAQAADTTLGSMTEVLARTKELSMMAGNATTNTKDLVAELKALREQMYQFANAKDTNGYLFSGDTSQAPFSGTPAYNGTPALTVEVAGTSVQSTFDGSPLAESLKAMDAMLNDLTTTGVVSSATADSLDTGLAELTTMRAGIGARASTAEMQMNLAKDETLRLQGLISSIEDADAVQESINLNDAKTQQEMNMKVLSMHFNAKRLLDYL